MECKKTGSWLIYDKSLTLPTSETQDSLKDGCRLRAPPRTVAKKQLNFQSYPMKRVIGVYKKKVLFEHISSYKRDYPPPGFMKCKPLEPKENDPDPLFNPRPVNDFLLLPSVSTKFMDDGLYNVSSGRMKINFFRQMRNQSYIFGNDDTTDKAAENDGNANH